VVIIPILEEEPKSVLFADGPTTTSEIAGRSRNWKENLQPLDRSQQGSSRQKQIIQLLVEVEKKRRLKDSR